MKGKGTVSICKLMTYNVTGNLQCVKIEMQRIVAIRLTLVRPEKRFRCDHEQAVARLPIGGCRMCS